MAIQQPLSGCSKTSPRDRGRGRLELRLLAHRIPRIPGVLVRSLRAVAIAKWDEQFAGPNRIHQWETNEMKPSFMFATGVENSYPTIHNGRERVDELEKCGHYQYWQIAKGNVLGMREILKVCPDAIFIQSESSEYFHASNPRAIKPAELLNERRYLSLDLNSRVRFQTGRELLFRSAGCTQAMPHSPLPG